MNIGSDDVVKKSRLCRKKNGDSGIIYYLDLLATLQVAKESVAFGDLKCVVIRQELFIIFILLAQVAFDVLKGIRRRFVSYSLMS
ncbi:hypothetical protein CEXT_48381 [Caerostris extrusa]|uniref:Uncharacterized protein n=1 Tax=Caerostris extrusa TaxID=172846 RepID=A0AAV4N0R5_CAEEX|nr:hypothetical protein CEXT_48381 [Caerostris extrusa]